MNHCRIRSKQDKQQTKFYLMDSKFFDSLYSLITYYRSNPLVTAEFAITLQEPVPQPKKHETEVWYHKNTGKLQAEEILKRIKTEGAFIVRPSENDSNCFTISFRLVIFFGLVKNEFNSMLYILELIRKLSTVESNWKVVCIQSEMLSLKAW